MCISDTRVYDYVHLLTIPFGQLTIQCNLLLIRKSHLEFSSYHEISRCTIIAFFEAENLDVIRFLKRFGDIFSHLAPDIGLRFLYISIYRHHPV